MSLSGSVHAAAPAATSRRRRLADRFGRAAVAVGGLAIIAGVLGILVFVLAETAPLFRGARVVPGAARGDAAMGDGPLVSDEKRDAAAFLAADGTLRAFDWAAGSSREIAPTAAKSAGATLVATTSLPGGLGFAAATNDGRVLLARLVWQAAPQGASVPAIAAEALLDIDPSRRPAALVAGALAEDGGATAAAMLADGHLVVLRRAVDHWGERLIEEQGFACMVELLLKLRYTDPVIVEVPLVLQYDRKQGLSKLRLKRTIGQYMKLLIRDRVSPAPYRSL